MRYEMFKDRRIHIIDLDDVNGERVIEFSDPATGPHESLLAVYNSGEHWSDAKVSVSPRAGDVPAEFMEWAIQIARRMMQA
ncbi:hypothetical protein [Catenulispora pinisilvae]|uniref:hypothetical protein n=1 Tax=Catenulispora pinisilvae TaxID=2705253 RepID=UPI001891B45E|nr:hypothetical protein [Catenulispora pinisilvae]